MAARKRPGRTTELNFDDVTEKPQAPEPREELWRLPLLDFIEAASGGRIAAPTHLAEAAALFERAERRECDLRAVVDAPVQHGKPLRWDTLVTMADGSRVPIASVRVGDRVVTGFGNVATVTGHYAQGELDTLRIVMRSGREVVAEGSHLFLVRSATSGDAKTTWRRADTLKNYRRGQWNNDWMMVGARYQTEPTAALSADEARFLGYIVGDGGVTGNSVMFTNADPAVVASFTLCARAVGGAVVPATRQVATPSYRVNGMAAKAFLVSHGVMGHGAHTKRVPRDVFAAPLASVAAFVAAYFECDGTRAQTTAAGRCGGMTAFYSVSKGLLEDVRHLLARLGVSSHLYAKRGKYKGRPHLSWQLSVTDDRAFFERVPVMGAKAGPSDRETPPNATGHIHDGVMRIEPAGRAECFCITVDRDACFLANDCVTHNTTLVEWGIAWLLLRHPDWPGMYITYDVRKAEKHSRRIRTIFLDNGGQIKADFNTIHQWETTEGGGLLATSRDGDMTGNSAAFVLFDDPYKNYEEASDADTRERLEEKYASEVETRMAPNGFIGIIASRWHESDLSGTKIAAGFVHVHLEAIRVDADGREQALCPWGPDAKAPRTLEWLRGRRAALIESGHESTWWSLYQGAPRPTGSGVFGDATWHEGELPPMVRWAWGVDLAFSAGAKGDRTAVVLLGLGEDGIVYVLLVWSVRQGIVECKSTLRGYLGSRPEAPIATYASGPEVGSYRAMAVERDPVRVLVMPARYSKYVRAKRTAERWNAHRVKVPAGRPWAPAFVRLVKGFTGADGDVDDEVDAFVAAHDRLMGTASVGQTPSDFLMGRRVM